MLKPVWCLKIGDTFKGSDGNWWKVEEILVPEISSHLGVAPKAYTIVAASNHPKPGSRRFYHYGAKLVEVKN